MLDMESFYCAAGDLLLVIHKIVGEAPTRTFIVRFEYERGWAAFDGRQWVRHIYSANEQQRIDAERLLV